MDISSRIPKGMENDSETLFRLWREEFEKEFAGSNLFHVSEETETDPDDNIYVSMKSSPHKLNKVEEKSKSWLTRISKRIIDFIT